MSSTFRNSVAAAILAGGRSSRMGTQKATVCLGKKHLVDYSVAAAAAMRPPPTELIVVTAPSSVAHFSCSIVLDRSLYDGPIRITQDHNPHQGPLAGLIAALEVSTTDVLVVLACDMPFVSARLMDSLVKSFGDSANAWAAVFKKDGIRHPFPAVLARKAAVPAKKLFESGKRSLQDLLSAVPTCIVDVPSSAPPYALDSVDTSLDLVVAEKRLQELDL